MLVTVLKSGEFKLSNDVVCEVKAGLYSISLIIFRRREKFVFTRGKVPSVNVCMRETSKAGIGIVNAYRPALNTLKFLVGHANINKLMLFPLKWPDFHENCSYRVYVQNGVHPIVWLVLMNLY